ncbi:protein ROS1A-like isoform X2 [Phragmites australis]|uniref:protein ROS1A-like isoform X2 n=1 Tax=Phragmites australis TaxID=29695 RepID=UPI002D76A882|nr:protein ROS1A-like isoform X2 [Phragmites australis]
MHMQDFGQWLPQSQNTANLCFTSILVPSHIDTSIETQTRTFALASSEKEYALLCNTIGVGPIEGIRNDAGSIVSTGNDAGPIRYDAGSIIGTGNDAGPIEGIDLNKTPAQKSKRKKHRPKVLKEGKPSKTPKSTTPKSSKEKEEKPSGKRKYVRKKTPSGQPPPEQAADSNCRAELKPVRRCLNFDGQYDKVDAHPGTQAKVTEISTDPKDYKPAVSSINKSNVQSQSACHADSTTSSIYSSANQMVNAQLLSAHNTQKGELIDLNSSSLNQIHNESTNFVDNPAQNFQSRIRETLEVNPLLELNDGMTHKNVPDLNSSISLLQSMSTNFAEYLLSSPQASIRQTQMANQMLNGHGMPENVITQTQCFERSCTRDAVVTDQMFNSYILANNDNPPVNTERNSVMENSNKLVTTDGYLRINTSPYRYTSAAVRPHDSHDLSHIHAVNTRREQIASNGAQTVLGAKFNHQNNGLASVSACHATTSEASYFPETYKRMRLNNHDYSLNGVVDNCCTSSAYLSNNRNANPVSAINCNVFTLADAQRVIAREKSQASQRMINFRSLQNSMAKRAEMELQHNRAMLPGTTFRDSIEGPDKQFRLVTQECAQSPSSPNNLQRQNVIAKLGNHQLQSLGGNMVSGSDLPAELHKRSNSPQDDTENSVCIAPPDELGRSISGEHFRYPVTRTNISTGNGSLRTESHQLETSVKVIRTPTNQTNPSTSNNVLRTENNQLEFSPKTVVAKPSGKRKVGRPRKELKPGEKPKPRGRPRKDNIVHAILMSKGSHTGPSQNVDISCVCGPHAEVASYARAVNSERVIESTAGATAPLIDSLDLIIQKIVLLDINKSDDIQAAEPHGALVPYKGEVGAIVPFEGKMKRKRSRAKVNLDPVTTLMWKLLMEPDMSDGAEAMAKDKEKWLDEERKIFRGRVDSFIARMHLVQGDRRFSPWKGSVVDSVVGVFLTQNVSDHLSSSAFMALAAKFPAKPEVSEKPAAGVFHTTSDENGSCSRLFGDAVKLQGEILVEEASNTAGSLITAEEKEGSDNTELFGSSSGDGLDYAAGVYSDSYRKLPARLHEKSSQVAAGTGSFVEAEDGSLEDVVSSQNSAISSQSSPDYRFHINEHMLSSTLLKFTAEDFIHRNMPNGTSSSATYTELLRMQEIKSKYNENIASSEYHEVPDPFTNKGSLLHELQNLRRKHDPLHTSVNYHQNGRIHLHDIAYGSNLGRPLYTALNTVDYYYSNATQAETSSHYPSSAPGYASTIKPTIGDSLSALLYSMDGSLNQNKSPFPSEPTQGADLVSPIIDTYFQPSSSEMVSFARDSCIKSLPRNEAEATFVKQNENSNLQEECTASAKQIGHGNFQSECSQLSDNVGIQIAKDRNGHSSNLCQKQKANCESLEGVASVFIETSKDAKKDSPVPTDGSKAKKARVGAGKKRTYDWDILRKEVLYNHGNKERGQNAKDSIDWERIRQADVKEISETIRERGMNNMLAERIKEFLNRLVTDHGSLDLEWLRYVEPDKAKDYLLSIRGLGLKSVECVRLLTLHHMAFPVDTNVGRICVRLGWVPLQPLPESLQLHLLELYPMLENIQKYLWPRLCKLDQRTLYELHYQMITFGKVFCTKSKPNCNACPMRAECKHFASAFASARLALPGPEEKSLVTSSTPVAAEGCNHTYINFRTANQNEGSNQTYMSSRPVSQLEWNSHARGHILDNGHPIIEEPASPELEPDATEIKVDAIEDAFIDDPEEIPAIKLNFTEFTQNLKNYMQANNIEIEDADMSKALVAITPEAASIPTPKLKNASRLRTEHQVYELPDSHPLLEGLDQREPDDPCPYLLSIWTPGETAQSTDVPKTFCNSQESGKLCESSTCFSCNSIREAQAQKVRGTILIPCRTAMWGSFPLNGTYFQVNEVFADHDTSRNPIDVPRSLIWNLPRRTVYFGTSVPTIFKGNDVDHVDHVKKQLSEQF